MPLLTVLKLTGNLIEKIENLETLVHLTDLNLSFNKIKRIENLDILGLRKLNLYSLNMAGNPCTRSNGFRNFIAAFIFKLEYYEYKKITEEEREEGRQTHLRELEVLERAEREEEKAATSAAMEAEKMEKHLQAFVENTDENQLYNMMLENDPHGQALMLIGEDIQEIFKRFEEGVGKCSEDIFNLGMEQFDIRQKEIELFNEGVQDAIAKSQAKQRVIIEEFLISKSEIYIKLSELSQEAPKDSESAQQKTYEEEMDKAYKMCLSMKKELLSLEFVLSEQLKELFAQFERSLGDMVNSFIETAQGFFTNMREHETHLSEQLGDQATRYFTQLTVRNEDLTSLPAPLRQIMIDKDAVNTAVASSHDIHLQTIDSREDELISHTRAWYQKLCHNYEQEEDERFRARVNEILNFLEIQAKDFHQYSLSLDEEAFALMAEGEEIAQN